MVEPFTMFLKGAFGQYGYLFILNCALILSLAATASPKQVPAENSTDCVDALDSAQIIPSSDHPVYSSSAPAQALPSISIPVTFDRTASIQPDEQLPTTVIPHGGLVDVSFSGHDFDFYSSLNPSFLMDTSGSLPEHSLDLPEDDTALIPEQSHQQTLPAYPFQDGPDSPITAWNKDVDSGQLYIFSPPRLRALARIASQSPSRGDRKKPCARPVVPGRIQGPSLHDWPCDSASDVAPEPFAAAYAPAMPASPMFGPPVIDNTSMAPSTTTPVPPAPAPPSAVTPTPASHVASISAPPACTGASVELSGTLHQQMEDVQPFNELINQPDPVRRSGRTRLPSTRLTDTNNVGNMPNKRYTTMFLALF
jgi:hypothetical protein